MTQDEYEAAMGWLMSRVRRVEQDMLAVKAALAVIIILLVVVIILVAR